MSTPECGCSNIDDKGATRRRVMGYASLVTAFALVGFNKIQQPPDWVLWMPAVPFFFGYLGLMQAQTRTCVMLALTERNSSEGRLKKRSTKILVGAGLLALASTAICLKL